jgi:hypothetical protein
MKTKLLILALFSLSFGGVTINYEGQIKKKYNVNQIIEKAKEISSENKWKFKTYENKDTLSSWWIGDNETKYRSALRGIIIQPDSLCEPLNIIVDDSSRMQDFIKTQFAGPEIHVKVIKLLEALKPFFDKFKIEDEGGYVPFHNQKKLEENMNKSMKMIQAAKAMKPKAKCPYILPSGRIVDIID